ncbi:hypothetical protein Gotur_006716 [Gossypium turneri]
MLTSFVLSIILTANTIYFIMHKSSGKKNHHIKKKVNSPVVEKRNKAPAEEQRTSTSRGTKNQHQQRNKEPAPAEEQRTNTSRGSKKQQRNK